MPHVMVAQVSRTKRVLDLPCTMDEGKGIFQLFFFGIQNYMPITFIII